MNIKDIHLLMNVTYVETSELNPGLNYNHSKEIMK